LWDLKKVVHYMIWYDMTYIIASYLTNNDTT
jgi:hypothetical protein